MANNTPVTKSDLAAMLAPFFYAKHGFRKTVAEKAGAYNCALCHKDIGALDQTYPISYNLSRYGTWCHLPCVTALGYTVSTDDALKHRVKKAAQTNSPARHAARVALLETIPPATPAPTETTVSLDTFETELRAKIELEYEALLDQAIARFDAMTATITDQNEQIRLLKLELEKVRSVAQVTDPLPVPTSVAQDRPDVARCGAPKGDGLPCKWNIARTACPHHTVPTTAPVSQTTTNARQNDSGLTDDEKRAARAQKRAGRAARLGKVA